MTVSRLRNPEQVSVAAGKIAAALDELGTFQSRA